jgi:TfoX/Sxy family transcriptional regulator of competence genes
MSEETKQKVTEYVHLNYSMYKNKPLIIIEKDSCFQVKIHEDGSPLILGKGILDN